MSTTHKCQGPRQPSSASLHQLGDHGRLIRRPPAALCLLFQYAAHRQNPRTLVDRPFERCAPRDFRSRCVSEVSPIQRTELAIGCLRVATRHMGGRRTIMIGYRSNILPFAQDVFRVQDFALRCQSGIVRMLDLALGRQRTARHRRAILVAPHVQESEASPQDPMMRVGQRLEGDQSRLATNRSERICHVSSPHLAACRHPS